MQSPNPSESHSKAADEVGSSRPAQKNPTGVRSAESSEIPKPPSKAYEWVAPGIYRYLKAGTLYERPWVNGRRTLRSLGTKDLDAAQCELRRRRGLPLTVQPPNPSESHPKAADEVGSSRPAQKNP